MLLFWARNTRTMPLTPPQVSTAARRGEELSMVRAFALVGVAASGLTSDAHDEMTAVLKPSGVRPFAAECARPLSGRWRGEFWRRNGGAGRAGRRDGGGFRGIRRRGDREDVVARDGA